MKVIWNFIVPFRSATPEGKVILCHDTVLPHVEYAWDDAIRFWTIHEQGVNGWDEDTHNWSFIVVATGVDIPDGYEYVGTTARNQDDHIWHLFRKRV